MIFKKNKLISLILLASFSCNQYKNEDKSITFKKEETIINDELKSEIILFSLKAKQHSVKENNFIIVTFDKQEKDTICWLQYTEPETCDNLIAVTMLENKHVFFYSSLDSLFNSKWVKIDYNKNSCLKYLSNKTVDLPYEKWYKIYNDQLLDGSVYFNIDR